MKRVVFYKLLLIGTILILIQSCETKDKSKNYTIDNLGIEMLFVDGGTYQMGDIWEDEKAWGEYQVHEVTVSDFYLSATEITNAHYCEFLNEEGNNVNESLYCLDLSGDIYIVNV